MELAGTRFGTIEIDAHKIILLRGGLIGMPHVARVALLEQAPTSPFAWLQSVDYPELAFPVIDGARFGEDYPDRPTAELARDAHLPPGDLGILVIVAVGTGQRGFVANVLAPILVNLDSCVGAQIVLDPRRYSAARAYESLPA